MITFGHIDKEEKSRGTAQVDYWREKLFVHPGAYDAMNLLLRSLGIQAQVRWLFLSLCENSQASLPANWLNFFLFLSIGAVKELT